ncbi:MAG: hypothetical protein AB1411_11580 [Nitrospirota bacterium]
MSDLSASTEQAAESSTSETILRRRMTCNLLMWLVAPTVLFGFFILFGSDSYQFWGERYHLNLTSKYLFSRLGEFSLPGPLWREDILSGSPWFASLVSSPYALHVLCARYFQLSPFGIDFLENVILYGVATVSMWIYLRVALSLSFEGSAVGAGTFAATAYWMASGSGVQDMPMGAAWFPALLAMAHAIDQSIAGHLLFRKLLLRVIALALLFYVYALNSSPSTLITVGFLLIAYTAFVFASVRSVLGIFLAVGLGFILYSPFFWSLAEATRISQRYLGDYFFHHEAFTSSHLLARMRDTMSRIAIGHNQYGVYPVVVLTVAVWSVLGPRLNSEAGRIKRIITFSWMVTVVFFLLELFSDEINFAKQSIPFLGGWTAERVGVFTFFPLLTLFSWMADRAILHPSVAELSEGRRTRAGWAVFLVGMLACAQIAVSVFRMKQVPPVIHPQDYAMFTYLLLYALATLTLIGLVYLQATRPSYRAGWPARPILYVWLFVLSVSLTTSVHSYRPGVLPARGGPNPDVTMTYAQRYAIPDDLVAVKRLNESDARVVDFTREMPNIPWTAEVESAMLPLSGIRTPSGYSLFHPVWYGRFIEIGVNGSEAGPFESIVQVRGTNRTNFEALGLLDVRYVLAYQSSLMPGYLPILQLDGVRKTLFAAQEEVGPAFVSSDVRCFINDTEALRYIHRSGLRDLRTHAVLVASDDAASPICSRVQDHSALEAEGVSPSIQVLRGADRVSIKVEGSSGGILTLGDSYYPGWKVYVDGVEKPLLRTYTTLRGVAIGVGNQSVEYVYEPEVFWLLFGLSKWLLGGLVLVALVTWAAGRFTLQRVRIGRQVA